jgi:hypothetical protein
MKLLSIAIAHYRVVKPTELASPSFETRLELTESCHDGLSGKFAHFCDLAQVRRINWTQSFAHRGFKSSDYEFEHAEHFKLGIKHQFRRLAGANPKLPRLLRFTELWGDSSLQGEVLFYCEKISVLHASRVSGLQCQLIVQAGGALQRELDNTFVHDRTVAATLGGLIETAHASSSSSARQQYNDEILKSWDDARSFLIVTL